MSLILTLVAIASAAAPPAPAVEIPGQPGLTEAIVARDREFFDLFFEGCDPTRLRTMLADDIEMYHDKEGFVFRSAEEVIRGYSKSCEERRKPDAWRSRRELVRSSLRVDPVPGHGAIEDGEHVFYERQGDGPERLVGRAHFTQLWTRAADGWRLSRIFSFAHAKVD